MEKTEKNDRIIGVKEYILMAFSVIVIVSMIIIDKMI